MTKMRDGQTFFDDRGKVIAFNDFNPSDCAIKRMYIVENFQTPWIRGWHGHRLAAKYITVLSGSALIGIAELNRFKSVFSSGIVEKFILSSEKPQILYVPKGYANGAKTLVPGTKILYMCTDTIEEAQHDDYRFDFNFINNFWEIKER